MSATANRLEMIPAARVVVRSICHLSIEAEKRDQHPAQRAPFAEAPHQFALATVRRIRFPSHAFTGRLDSEMARAAR